MQPNLPLSRAERHLLDTLKQRGLRGFVVRLTLVSIGLSVLLTSVLLAIARTPLDFWLFGIAIAVIVPAVVAPTVAHIFGRLLRIVDEASSELRVLARTDPLTRVLNRRAFTDDVETLLATPRDGVLVVAMIDIDRFKAVNDRHGHAVGDASLQALADALKAAVDGSGNVGRLGGDEFAVVALAPNETRASQIASCLIDACDLTEAVPGLRASIGVIVIEGRPPLSELLACADMELYRRKGDHRQFADRG